MLLCRNGELCEVVRGLKRCVLAEDRAPSNGKVVSVLNKLGTIDPHFLDLGISWR
jgi:hypothetical protein